MSAARKTGGRRWADALYRVALIWRGPAYWHWRYYGWDYAARRDGDGWQVRAFGHDYRFGTLARWQHAPDTIHILLSGPSVRQIAEPRQLTSWPVIAVNGSYRLLAEHGLQADLYIVVDIGYVRRQWDAFVAGVRAAKVLAIDHRMVVEIVRRDPQLLRGIDVRLFDSLLRPYRRSSRWWTWPAVPGVVRDGRRAAFSMVADAGYFPSATVAYLALQIAATQRPRRIVFFGLDLNGSGRFYREGSGEKTMIADDYEQKILPDFAFAAGVLREAGITVVNASPDSALPDAVFERVPAAAALDAAAEPP
jgi:KDO transferase-3